MRQITLTKGLSAQVDDEDFDKLNRHKWRAWKGRTHSTFYAIRSESGGRVVLMHREIMLGVDRIDHQDGNGLNNQRSNLRSCSESQNQANRRKRSGCSSTFKGVTWDKQQKRWRAQITQQYKHKTLGTFSSEEEAARAYDAEARMVFGEFAKLNFP